MSNINDKLAKLQSGTDSKWQEEAKFRIDNRGWLRKSAVIALKVLDALKTQGLSQKDLAERMGVSPQQINKIVKGHENLTLETITNLELALGIKVFDDSIQKQSA